MAIVASRLERINASQTLSLAARTAELRQQGRDVINLGLGELDLPIPEGVRNAAARAAMRGLGASTPVLGTLKLRGAIAEKLHRDLGLSYTDREIIVGAGSKQVIFNAMMATLEPGDEVIVPAPYWVSYPDIVAMAGGTAVIARTTPQTGFKLDATALEAAITSRTKWLVMNSPNNPSAAVYTPDELRRIGAVLSRHPDVLLLSDEIYEHFVFSHQGPVSVVAQLPELRQRALLVNGLSKSHAMIGWRLGYGAGPQELISAMAKVQSQVTSSTCSIVQEAAEEALLGPQGPVAAIVDALARRREIALDRVARIAGLKCAPADGAFYLFAECSEYIGKRTPAGSKLESDADVSDYLLVHGGVAVVPGGAFGMSPYLRIAYACDEALLREAMSRMESALGRLH
jgi:aspartate aminotransferase